jgi:FtsP/CotA-like multicopper oxidase with cupredoxin domain
LKQPIARCENERELREAIMKTASRKLILLAIPLLAFFTMPAVVTAEAFVQCPGDTNGDAIIDTPPVGRDVKCQHLTSGDGWVTMADGREIYIFGFSDVTGIPQEQVLQVGIFRANFPAPLIRTRENQELYLSMTNVGLHNRPDLFDPHSVHYHGFPNAASIFDGLPEAGLAINQQASITYYYNNIEPGTYMWHCHVEATEHMQMGMLGNLYVEPFQNQTGCPGGACPIAKLEGGPAEAPQGYVYNDGDGSTAYDKEYYLQLGAFYHVFHDASRDVQPLPFAEMHDTYPMINGRGYPDTALPEGQHPPIPDDSSADPPQPVGSRITATQGQQVLLRISNLAVVRHYTLTVLGIPMKVVGHGARLLRGAGQSVGQNIFFNTNVITLGGGESADIILDTSSVAPGKYFLYTTNLNLLSNNDEDYGGMMTEIIIN